MYIAASLLYRASLIRRRSTMSDLRSTMSITFRSSIGVIQDVKHSQKAAKRSLKKLPSRNAEEIGKEEKK